MQRVYVQSHQLFSPMRGVHQEAAGSAQPQIPWVQPGPTFHRSSPMESQWKSQAWPTAAAPSISIPAIHHQASQHCQKRQLWEVSLKPTAKTGREREGDPSGNNHTACFFKHRETLRKQTSLEMGESSGNWTHGTERPWAVPTAEHRAAESHSVLLAFLPLNTMPNLTSTARGRLTSASNSGPLGSPEQSPPSPRGQFLPFLESH